MPDSNHSESTTTQPTQPVERKYCTTCSAEAPEGVKPCPGCFHDECFSCGEKHKDCTATAEISRGILKNLVSAAEFLLNGTSLQSIRPQPIECASTQAFYVLELGSRDAPEAAGTGKPFLSPRENEVCRMLSNSQTVPEISEILGISPHTVRNHLKSAFRKTGATNQVQLVNAVRGTSFGAKPPPGGVAKALRELRSEFAAHARDTALRLDKLGEALGGRYKNGNQQTQTKEETP